MKKIIQFQRSFLSKLAVASIVFAGVVSSVEAQAQKQTIPLWSGETPEAKGSEPTDIPSLQICLAEKGNGSAILVIPGGGYGGLAMGHEGHDIAKFFNDLGFHAYILSYRLGSKGYHHPVQLNDAKRAMKLVRSFAKEHGFNPEKLGVIGFSAGGHLASMTGTLFDDADPSKTDSVDQLSSRPDFLILCYPVITLSKDFTHHGSRNNLLGPDQKENEQLADRLSSQKNVTSKTPPTFIFHTDADTVVPAENPVGFYLALRENKVPVEMHIYQHGNHGVGLAKSDEALSTWTNHLKAWLVRNQFMPQAPQ